MHCSILINQSYLKIWSYCILLPVRTFSQRVQAPVPARKLKVIRRSFNSTWAFEEIQFPSAGRQGWLLMMYILTVRANQTHQQLTMVNRQRILQSFVCSSCLKFQVSGTITKLMVGNRRWGFPIRYCIINSNGIFHNSLYFLPFKHLKGRSSVCEKSVTLFWPRR